MRMQGEYYGECQKHTTDGAGGFLLGKDTETLQLYFNGPRSTENRLMYLVSATLFFYGSTDLLHFCRKKAKKILECMKVLKENISRTGNDIL